MGLQVVKRNGEKEDVRFDAIQEKLSRLSEGLNQDWVDPGLVTKLVIEGLYDGVTTNSMNLRSISNRHREANCFACCNGILISC